MLKRERTYSDRIRSYEAVYNEYVRNKSQSPHKKVIKITKPIEQVIKSSHGKNHAPRTSHAPSKAKPDKTLNSYQKFVQEENKKEKYAKLSGKERMAVIATAWEKKKRQLNKERKDKMKLKKSDV